MDRRAVLTAGLAGSTLLASGASASAAGPVEEVKLWPKGPPGGGRVQVTFKSVEDHENGHSVGRSITGVMEPLVTIHKARTHSDTAILCIGGGSFKRILFDKEGEDICRLLNGQGVSAGSLMYRLPAEGWSPDAPVADAKRALRLLAQATGARRLGVIGFSAGGTIAAAVATRWDEALYEPIDAADALDVRPSFMGLGYPYLNRPAPPAPAASMFHGMTKASPPAFLFAAADDPLVRIENSTAAHQALTDLKIPAALHIFEKGGHGFGLHAPPESSAAKWPELFVTWLKAGGFAGGLGATG
ncbi:MAG: alpha/beta hydrolase [Proteobacteria bacterium]|nr:alpha/beta hydrolase [Pseudomonadota bacterium]